MEAIETKALITEKDGAGKIATVRQSAETAREGVVVRTHYSGISTGTDKWVLTGRYVFFEWPRPVVIGYQRVGVVESVPPGSNLEPGQLVAATSSLPFVDATAGWGGHVQRASSPAAEVFDIADVDPIAASLLVTAQVGVNAASRITDQANRRVLVVGDGIIGSSAAFAARARGFEVILIGRHEERLAPLRRHGIQTWNERSAEGVEPKEFEPLSVIDTIHSDEAFASYTAILPPAHGEVVFSGYSPDGATHWANMSVMQQLELTTHFVAGWTRERCLRTLDLMRQGLMPLSDVAAPPTAGDSAINALLETVIAGRLAPTAAVVDWSDTR